MTDAHSTETGRCAPPGNEGGNGFPATRSPESRLNSFQKTMLQWNDLHPYNAVHAVRIPEALNCERLNDAISGTLESHGLTGLKLDRKKGTFCYQGGRAMCDIQVISGEANSHDTIGREVERLLNTDFAVGDCFNPFRFFVAPETESACWLGLAYFHPVADGHSMVLLLQDIVRSYRERQRPSHCSPLNLYPAAGGLLHHPRLLAKKLLALPAQTRNLRCSCRPVFLDAQNCHNGVSWFSLKPEALGSLLEAGQAWEVTVNDLFLALLMKAVSPLASGRTGAARRRKISVGSIVNLRNDLELDSGRNFGLFLGSFVVTHEVPDEMTLPELAKEIRRQTLALKNDRLYMASSLDLALGRLAVSFFSAERRMKFYQKHYPLWGGVTNMNLNTLWPQRDGEDPVNYLRAVSTGPATPLVLSVTTIGKVVNIALTHRSTVFPASAVAQIRHYLVDTLTHLQAYV